MDFVALTCGACLGEIQPAYLGHRRRIFCALSTGSPDLCRQRRARIPASAAAAAPSPCVPLIVSGAPPRIARPAAAAQPVQRTSRRWRSGRLATAAAAALWSGTRRTGSAAFWAGTSSRPSAGRRMGWWHGVRWMDGDGCLSSASPAGRHAAQGRQRGCARVRLRRAAGATCWTAWKGVDGVRLPLGRPLRPTDGPSREWLGLDRSCSRVGYSTTHSSHGSSIRIRVCNCCSEPAEATGAVVHRGIAGRNDDERLKGVRPATPSARRRPLRQLRARAARAANSRACTRSSAAAAAAAARCAQARSMRRRAR